MRRLILYLLAAVVGGGMLFGWGYRRGAASLDVRDSVTVVLKPLPPLQITVREPWPVAVHEPADTVWQTLPADTAAIIADYLREREYRLDFSTDTTGRFLVDATVGRNRLLAATATVEPLIHEVTQMRTVVREVVQVPRWEVGPAAGAWFAPQGGSVWVGGQVRRTFGRLSLSGTLGYDTHNGGVCGQVAVGVAVWRK